MIWYGWIPECYTDILSSRIVIVSQNYCHFYTSWFSRTYQNSIYFLGKKSSLSLFMTVIASNIEWLEGFLFLSSSFCYPDIPHCPFGQLLSQIKLLFHSFITTACQQEAECHTGGCCCYVQLSQGCMSGSLSNVNPIFTVIVPLQLTEVTLTDLSSGVCVLKLWEQHFKAFRKCIPPEGVCPLETFTPNFV